VSGGGVGLEACMARAHSEISIVTNLMISIVINLMISIVINCRPLSCQGIWEVCVYMCVQIYTEMNRYRCICGHI